MAYLSYSKDFQGLIDVFMRDPERYLPLAQLVNNVMTRESELSHAQRELIALYSSRLNHCSYCVDSHTCVLTSLGTAQNVLTSLTDISKADIDDKMKTMLMFVEKLTLRPNTIVKEDIQALVSQGWLDQTIEDAICVVATFALFNRLVDGIGLTASAEYFQQGGEMVAQQGYGPLAQMLQQQINR